MPNIYNLNGDVFRFKFYNLNYFKECDTEISGHYTFWYSKKSNKFVFCKHGDYFNLVSILPVKENPRFPTESEAGFLHELVYDKTIRRAYFYDGNAPCNWGKYLLDEIESKFYPESSVGHESIKSKVNEYYNFYHKYNCIFDVDYPPENYQLDKEYWNNLKEQDKKAIELLN